MPSAGARLDSAARDDEITALRAAIAAKDDEVQALREEVLGLKKALASHVAADSNQDSNLQAIESANPQLREIGPSPHSNMRRKSTGISVGGLGLPEAVSSAAWCSAWFPGALSRNLQVPMTAHAQKTESAAAPP